MPRLSWILLGSALAAVVAAGVALVVAPSVGVKFAIVAFPLATFLALLERGSRP